MKLLKRLNNAETQFKIFFLFVIAIFIGTVSSFFSSGTEATAVSILMIVLSALNVALFGAVLYLNQKVNKK